MSIGSPGELLTALARKKYDAILGTPEGDNLDFKEHPYRLDEEKGKWELSKDVAAMANTNGGCLVIGYSVRRGPTDIAEVADELRPVPVEQINPDQYKMTLASSVYPPPTVSLHAFAEGLPEERQVFVVEVIRDITREPFLVRRMPNEAGKVSSEAIGIPSRFHDHTIWASAEELHQRIKGSGPLPSDQPVRRTTPAEHAVNVHQQSDILKARSENRLIQIADLQEWQSEPLYSLHAIPAATGQELDDLHDPSGLGGIIQRPKGLRPMGFGLTTGTTEVIEGALIGRSDRGPVVWLEPDGFFTATALGTREYLAWAINENVFPQRPWTLLNSLVLVEFTLEFFRLIYSALVPRIRGPWLYGVRCRGFQSGHLRLASGFPKSVVGHFEENTKPASSEDWWRTFVDQGEKVPGQNAFKALTSVYQLFGLPFAAIPFTDESEVSEEAIRAIRWE